MADRLEAKCSLNNRPKRVAWHSTISFPDSQLQFTSVRPISKKNIFLIH